METKQRRKLIRHLAATGCSDYEASARYAGFSGSGPGQAQRVLRSPGARLALREEVLTHYYDELPTYRAALHAIATNPEHKDHAKVLIWLHSVMGVSPVDRSERVERRTLEVRFDRGEALAELRRLEGAVGLPAGSLLAGGVIEGDASEVEGASE